MWMSPVPAQLRSVVVLSLYDQVPFSRCPAFLYLQVLWNLAMRQCKRPSLDRLDGPLGYSVCNRYILIVIPWRESRTTWAALHDSWYSQRLMASPFVYNLGFAVLTVVLSFIVLILVVRHPAIEHESLYVGKLWIHASSNHLLDHMHEWSMSQLDLNQKVS